MNIDFFFDENFFDSVFGDVPENGHDEIEFSTTRIEIQHPITKAIGLIQGSGFTFDNDGEPTGGTITRMAFRDEFGNDKAVFSDFSWSLPAFVAALDALDNDDGPLTALFNSTGGLTFDASGANSFSMENIDLDWSVPLTVLGSDGNDLLEGGDGNDTITPGESDGFDVVRGSGGSDLIDYTASVINYQELHYHTINTGITVNLNGDTNSATIKKGNLGTDTLINVSNPLDSGWIGTGALGIHGTAKRDVFNVTNGVDTWMQVSGGAGDDTFNLTVSQSSGLRVDYRWTGDSGPANGVFINLTKGKALDDGHGDVDVFNITGQAEFRLTDMDDTFIGSAGNDRVILMGGNDAANGKDGWDTVRYDRSGVDWIDADLGAGTVTGVWHGQSFTHSVNNFEEIRGSREGHDRIKGSDGDNRIDGRAGSNFVEGSGGDDTIVFHGAGDDYQDLSYASLSKAIRVTIDGDANVGTVKKVKIGNDTLDGIQTPLKSGWTDGGLGLFGTAKNDIFTLDGGAETWMQVSGGAGKDEFNLTLSGIIRLNYSWDGADGPTEGVNIQLAKGKAFNDGFGNIDTINVLGGDGKLQVRATDFDDKLVGSGRDEDFITEQGDDVVNGKGGEDTIRYDRSGVDAVNVNLKKGWAKGTWDGNAFEDTLSNIENARGSREADDKLTGTSGANRLEGKGGNDALYGLGGKDDLRGDDGNDILSGGGGADILRGGYGDDVMKGGGGADVFEYYNGSDEGADKINAFQDGTDVILVHGGSMNDVTIKNANGGSDTRIVFDDGTKVLLKGIDKALIDASDFDFV